MCDDSGNGIKSGSSNLEYLSTSRLRWKMLRILSIADLVDTARAALQSCIGSENREQSSSQRMKLREEVGKEMGTDLEIKTQQLAIIQTNNYYLQH